MYDEEMIAPMRAELSAIGFQEVKTGAEVDEAIANHQTVLAVINSVCGSASSVTRPAVASALEQARQAPDSCITAFAGNDTEAVNQIRSYLGSYPPSSPFVALFRDGKLVYAMERTVFKTLLENEVTPMLLSALDRFCGNSVDESVSLYQPEDTAFVPNTCGV